MPVVRQNNIPTVVTRNGKGIAVTDIQYILGLPFKDLFLLVLCDRQADVNWRTGNSTLSVYPAVADWADGSDNDHTADEPDEIQWTVGNATYHFYSAFALADYNTSGAISTLPGAKKLSLPEGMTIVSRVGKRMHQTYQFGELLYGRLPKWDINARYSPGWMSMKLALIGGETILYYNIFHNPELTNPQTTYTYLQSWGGYCTFNWDDAETDKGIFPKVKNEGISSITRVTFKKQDGTVLLQKNYFGDFVQVPENLDIRISDDKYPLVIKNNIRGGIAVKSQSLNFFDGIIAETAIDGDADTLVSTGVPFSEPVETIYEHDYDENVVSISKTQTAFLNAMYSNDGMRNHRAMLNNDPDREVFRDLPAGTHTLDTRLKLYGTPSHSGESWGMERLYPVQSAYNTFTIEESSIYSVGYPAFSLPIVLKRGGKEGEPFISNHRVLGNYAFYFGCTNAILSPTATAGYSYMPVFWVFFIIKNTTTGNWVTPSQLPNLKFNVSLYNTNVSSSPLVINGASVVSASDIFGHMRGRDDYDASHPTFMMYFHDRTGVYSNLNVQNWFPEGDRPAGDPVWGWNDIRKLDNLFVLTNRRFDADGTYNPFMEWGTASDYLYPETTAIQSFCELEPYQSNV